MKGQKRMRTKRYINERREKLWEVDHSFCRPEVVKIFHSFLCVLSFTQLAKLLGKIDFRHICQSFTLLSNFFLYFRSVFAISWIRNGNPVNWAVWCLKVRLINIRFWYTFELHRNWPKNHRIEQFSIMFSQFSLYQRLFNDIRINYIIFVEFLVNLSKAFNDLCFSSQKLCRRLMLTFYGYFSRYCLILLPLENIFKNQGLGFVSSNFKINSLQGIIFRKFVWKYCSSYYAVWSSFVTDSNISPIKKWELC